MNIDKKQHDARCWILDSGNSYQHPETSIQYRCASANAVLHGNLSVWGAASLETLYETESLKDEVLYKSLHEKLQTLGRQINKFIQSVEKSHRTNGAK